MVDFTAQAREVVERSRRDQGLPLTIEDPTVLDEVDRILLGKPKPRQMVSTETKDALRRAEVKRKERLARKAAALKQQRIEERDALVASCLQDGTVEEARLIAAVAFPDLATPTPKENAR